MTDPSTFLAFARATPGREADFDRWYDDVHLPEVLEVPGIVHGQKFRLGPDQMPAAYTPACAFTQVALYGVGGDPAEVGAEVARRAEEGVFHLTDAMAPAETFFFEPRIARRGAPHDDAHQALLIFSEPTPGNEEEFHSWYEEVHLDEVLATPGIAAAQRFTHSARPMPPRLSKTPPHRDLAIYAVDGPAAEVAAEFERRLLEGVFRMSPAIDLTTLRVWFFSPAMSRRLAPAHAQ